MIETEITYAAPSRPFVALEEFTAWLDSKHPSASVGYPGDACDCPLATFIKQTVPGAGKYDVITVTSDQIVAYKGTHAERMDTPDWASFFITVVDDVHTSFADGTPARADVIRFCLRQAVFKTEQVKRLMTNEIPI